MSVCRHLKTDSGPVLAGMPDPDPLRSVRVTAAISQPLGGVLTKSPPQRSLWLILGLLVLALLAWFMIGVDRDTRPSATVEVPEMPPVTTLPAAESSAEVPLAPSEANPATATPGEADKPVTPAPVSKP